MMSTEKSACPFCELESQRVVDSNEHCFALRDLYPVAKLHTLIIPKRHVSDYFGLSGEELEGIHSMILSQRGKIVEEDPTVEGFNIGMNCGEVAGQTIFHCHVHLIPRRRDDVDNPRGGVRHLIPGMGDYSPPVEDQ